MYDGNVLINKVFILPLRALHTLPYLPYLTFHAILT